MAEEENKKKQNQPADDKSGGSTPIPPQDYKQNQPKKKKSRRRRRRKPKDHNKEEKTPQIPPQSQKKKRRRPKKRPKQEEIVEMGGAAIILEEPILEEPIEEVEDVLIEDEPINEESTEEEDVFAVEEPVAEQEDILNDEEPSVEEAVVEETTSEEEDILVDEEPVAEETTNKDEGFDDLFEEEKSEDEPVSEPEKKFETEEELLGITANETTEDQEEAFLASDEPAADEPQAEPEEVVKEAPPEPPAPAEVTPPPELPQQGPVGWDQLKQAIKKDNVEPAGQETPVPVPVPIPDAPTEEPEVESAPEAEVTPKEPDVIPAVEEKSVEEIQAEPVPIVEPISSGHEELHADDDAEKKEIIRIIVKYTAGGCMVIILIAAIFIFKLPQAIIGMFSGSGQKTTQQEVVIPIKQPSKDDVEEGIGTAILTGSQIPMVKRVSSGIRASFEAGLPFVSTSGPTADRIETYLNVLNKLQNAFATDIHQLLDVSGNRANALEVHLSELTSAYRKSVDTFKTLSEEIDIIKIEFNEVTTQKNRLEEEFFSAMDRLESKTADVILNDFIDVSQKQINLKAEFNALTKTAELFEVAIQNMDLRIQDIEANKEALIKGVKVVNIKGSDLDLIIQDGE